jgi:hypothetical protein
MSRLSGHPASSSSLLVRVFSSRHLGGIPSFAITGQSEFQMEEKMPSEPYA